MFRKHRSKLLAALEGRRAAGVFSSGSPKIRNHDCEYRFRPDSDFWYLTGFAEPEGVLLLLPANGSEHSVLFLRENNRDEEIWQGRRLGVDNAPRVLGVDLAYPIDELWERLPELLKGHEAVVYKTGVDEGRDRQMIETVSELRAGVRRGVIAPSEWIDPANLLHEQRLIKTSEEVDLMRRAAEITTEAHVEAMRQAGPGVNEAEIDALLEYTFRRRGATGAAYTNIVAGGPNACILHYVENDAELRDGDLLLIDAGAEWSYYASDVTRTFPVNGRFTDAQRALYEVVLEAQMAAIAHTAPGVSFLSVHEVAVERIARGLVELGLLEGPVSKVIEDESYERYYMHKTGHWLGIDVHDCGVYFLEQKSRPLEPGMVLTVEPGIYVPEDDESVDEKWRGIGIRIEDDLLVTPSGHEVLTAAIPKSVEEVEAVVSGASLVSAG